MCLDINGDVIAVKYLGTGNAIRALETQNSYIFCALDDLSLRGWNLEPDVGKLSELFHVPAAHSTSCIGALCFVPIGSISKGKGALISGCDTGSLRVWMVSEVE